MFFLLYLFERIKEPIGASSYLPRVTSSNTTRFIKENPTVVLFCTPKHARLDFANFAIAKFSAQISFAIVDNTESICSNSKGTQILSFRGGRRQNQEPTELRPISFTRWCSHLIYGDWVILQNPDELRELLDTPGSFVIAVDAFARPSHIEPGITVFGVPSIFFAHCNMSVSAGVHVFRSSDRQLVRVTGAVKKYLQSPLVDACLVNTSEREFFGGFLVDEREENGTAVEVLTRLAQQHKNAQFALLAGDTGAGIAERLGLSYVARPCFVMMRGGERWVKRGYDVDSFVEEIGAGRQPANHLSGSGILTYDTWGQVIGDGRGDKAVVFTVPGQAYARRLNVTLFKVKEVASAPALSVFAYDLSENEIPQGFEVDEGPSLFLFPEGAAKAVPYDGGNSFVDVMDFVAGEVTNKFGVPKFNASAIETEISDVVTPGLARFRVKPKAETERDDSL